MTVAISSTLCPNPSCARILLHTFVILLSSLLLLSPAVSAFSLFSSSLVPPHPDLDAAALLAEALHPPIPLEPIPLLVHYVYGLRSSSQVLFELDDFISVKSAIDILGARRVLFWTLNVPQGPWWDAMLDLGRQRAKALHLSTDSLIEVKHVDDRLHVFGRLVESSAHKADVLRMEALLTYGGVYMDMDVVALKPMTELIAQGHPCILGQEMTAEGTHPHGLGNAYMLASKGAAFYYEWYQGYKRFDFHQWATLSIHLPGRLAHAMPRLCHELDPWAFYFPSFDEAGKREMYEANTWDLSRNYAVHLWSGGKKWRRGQTTFADLCALNNTWGRIARTVLLAGDGNENTCNGRGIA